MSYPAMQHVPHLHHPICRDAAAARHPDALHPPHSDYESRFHIRPRKRSFSFEELQSGSFFESLDETDLQFYRIYGQPVLIPPPDDSHDGLVLHSGPLPLALQYPYTCEPSPHNPSDRTPSFFKSYALAGSLGDAAVTSPLHGILPTQSSSTTHHHTTQLPHSVRIIQSSMHIPYPANFPSDHLGSHAGPAYPFEQSSVPQYNIPPMGVSYVDDSNAHSPAHQTVADPDPPMDHLPFPAPSCIQSLSPPYYQCASPQDEHGQTPPFGQNIPAPPISQQSPQAFPTSSASGSTGWTDTAPQSHITVPSQALAADDLTQTSTSPTHDQTSRSEFTASVQAPRRRTRSPSPRSHQQARASLAAQQHPGKGRSLDKKPALACLFCRGRKIACGPPMPGSKDKTCK
ncbi:hypothetical protein ID866_7762 [Astraeus odoratus]|nr:hypothetical protein ID866_7762 [Astraeus odoratus]